MFAVIVVLTSVSGYALAGPASGGKTSVDAPLPMPPRYALFDLDGPLPETLPAVYLLEPDVETLYDLIERIGRAERDSSVKGIVVLVGSLGAGWAKVQEVREALMACRRAGKSVTCFLEGGGNLTYYLASVADRVVLVPSSSLMLVGLRGEVLFFKGLLDKIGVSADLLQFGQYKGASEPFTRQQASEHFRQAMDSLLNDYYRQLCEGIAAGRGVTREQAAALIDRGPYTARAAKAAGLVDELMYYDEMMDDIREQEKGRIIVDEDYGREALPTAEMPGLKDFFSALMGLTRKPSAPLFPKSPAIALIYAVGPIVVGDEDDIGLGDQIVVSEVLLEVIRAARNAEHVKAIVLRVDSPGGSAVASDMIWRELRRADEVKPVIVSLSDVAASGGYYIAAGGRTIVADPATITGSIGVVGGKFIVGGLFDKVGLTVEVFQRGQNAGIMSSSSSFSDSERQKLTELLEDTYNTFLSRVASARNKTVEEIGEVAQGKPWTGEQARGHELVDAIGGLAEAIELARTAAGIDPAQSVKIVRLPRPRGLFEVLLWGKSGESAIPPLGLAGRLPTQLERARVYLNALSCFEEEPAVLLMPAMITIR